jgi:UDP-2-acetamido-3-amino-2,3-dideoxy-glucuronate N-acetyltransferase
MSDSDYFIHESSYMDEPCQIGAGTKIWHSSHIMKNCRIGRRCNIGQNVMVSPDVVIGDNVKFQNNVSVYTGVILEDDVFCGSSMVLPTSSSPAATWRAKTSTKRHWLSKALRSAPTARSSAVSPVGRSDRARCQVCGLGYRKSGMTVTPGE